MTEAVVPRESESRWMKELLLLKDRKDELKKELSKTEEDIRNAESAVLGFFEKNEIDSVSIDGRTLYVHRQLWANGKKDIDPEIVIEALKENGLGDIVKETFSSQSLSAYVRELDDREEPLSDGLAEVIKVIEKVSVRVRRK